VVDLSLDLSEPNSHLVHVCLRCTPTTPVLRLRLPAWTPGSYLIRDYARHLEGLEIRQGDQRLLPSRIDPSGWRLELPSGEPLEIRYRVLAADLTLRTCHLDGDHGFLALAALVLEVEGERWAPHRLSLCLPEGWRPFVPLPLQADGSWLARDFDQLLDTPVEVGPHREHHFSVAGVPHRWVCWDAMAAADGLLMARPTLLQDLAAVCEACCRLMGEPVPAAPDYLFVLHLLDQGYGGLEHDTSTVLQFSHQSLRKPEGYRQLLQLAAHEYLHQWNVRRLRPAALCPIDYHSPVIVSGLWFAEGVTSYFDQLLPHLAGLSSEDDVIEDFGTDLNRYLLTPGRFHGQSLRQSSEEAWVKLYRREANSDDSQISYYLKGAILSLVLDLELRRAGSCLAQVLRDLWASFGRWGRGYREHDLLEAFTARSPALADRLPAWLDGFEDPDLPAYLQDVGLRLEPQRAQAPHLGLKASLQAGGALEVVRVLRSGPAQRAGVVLGDELIALDGLRLRKPEDLSTLLQADQRQSLTICRRGHLRSLAITAAPPAIERWRLLLDPAAGPGELERRRQWLGVVPC
jgi:predicted metalloprotease with PDZ domain